MSTIDDLIQRLRQHARVVGQGSVESGNATEAAVADDCSRAADALERLRDALRQAQPEYCSMRCPSVFYSPDAPRHLPECDAMRTLAGATED